MNFKEIQELIRLVSKSDLAEFKMKEADFEITIKTGKAVKTVEMLPTQHFQMSAPQQHIEGHSSPPPTLKSPEPATAPTPKASNLIEIKSPMVGTFYRSSGPDKPPFIKVGDMVDVGTTVCIIEAMKLFNEIECEIKGTIVKVVVEDASPVEYDQVLFLVEP